MVDAVDTQAWLALHCGFFLHSYSIDKARELPSFGGFVAVFGPWVVPQFTLQTCTDAGANYSSWPDFISSIR